MIRDCEERVVVRERIVDADDYQERIGFYPIEVFDGYGALIGEGLRSRLGDVQADTRADALEDRITDLETKVNLILQLLRVQSPEAVPEANLDPAPAPEADPAPVADPAPAPEAAPEAVQVDAPETDKVLSTQFWGLLRQRCASCHSGDTAKAQFKLFEADRTTAVKLDAAMVVLIDQLTYSNQMPPPPAQPLTEDEYSLVSQFVHSYSQQIRELVKSR